MAKQVPIQQTKPESAIISRCDFLADANVWPHRGAIDVRQWLKNFKGKAELDVARNLLERFLFYPDRMTRELLRSAVRGIMPHLLDFSRPPAEVKGHWKRITEQMLVIPVRGETPSDADSGNRYIRLVRDNIGIPEERLKSAPGIFDKLSRPSDTDPYHIVVFVDDFVGTGTQFNTVWKRLHQTGPQTNVSFKTLSRLQHTKFFYCPLVATSQGMEAIRQECGDELILCPAYVLTPEYNALHPNSRIWRDSLRVTGPRVLADIAERIGMPDTEGNSVDDWKGYGELGLGIVLNDSMPDACLGVFKYSADNWKPLFNKAG